MNLALAYTELTEELGRVRDLAVKQSDLLRQASQEPGRSAPPCFVSTVTKVSDLTEFSVYL